MAHYPKSRRAGVALILVLAFLVLISAIIFGFFSSVTHELTSSNAAANSASVQQLSDSAVNVVMAQIVDATKSKNSSNATITWASQPGMIRTYGPASGSTAAAPLVSYKLYSSDAMQATGTTFDSTDDLDGQWNLKPALFTDLNSPAADSGGKIHFPIIDPRAQITPGATGTNGSTATSVVDGFFYGDTAVRPTGKPTVKMNLLNAGGSGADNQRLPMPVKWIYVLKDGTLTVPTGVDATGAIANWSSSTKKPSVTNPIVGRIAFWTDDETCKVNINTASEGVYWDVPRIMSKEDFGVFQLGPYQPGMSYALPAQYEFNRYPGHPACTSLSTIFGNANWSPLLLPVPSPYPANPTTADALTLDPYYNLAPRIGLSTGRGSGGSKGGTVQVSPSAISDLQASPPFGRDTDRLYASVDELMFSPNLIGSVTGDPSDIARIPSTSATSAPQIITRDVLEKTRFFLTASSSAPETTVFNTPRVAVWPVWSPAAVAAGKTTTAYEKLLTFCSSIGGKAYGFSRANPRSCTDDYNNIARNQELYAYLQRLTGTTIPGFGGSFLTKYPAGAGGVKEVDQILTYIYDYIRCTNLQDRSAGASSFTPVFSLNSRTLKGAGEVLPIKIPVTGGTTQGFGRFLSVSSATLVFYSTNQALGKTDKMRAVFLLNPSSPAQGSACTRSNLKYKVVSGLDQLKAGLFNLNFKPGGTAYVEVSELDAGGKALGGTESPYLLTKYYDSATSAVLDKLAADADAGADAPDKFPFFSSADVAVSTTSTTFNFTAPAEIVVEVHATDTDELVQTLRFKFPNGTFNIPTQTTGGALAIVPYSKISVGARDTAVSLEVGGSNVAANASSAAQTVDNTAGDIRMLAGLADVPSNRYRAHFNYKDSGVQFAFHMMNGGNFFNNSSFGKLAQIAGTYPGSMQPDVPKCVTTGASRTAAAGGAPGDWDSGWGDTRDGAYINKPDEAATQSAGDMHYRGGYFRGTDAASSAYFSPNRMIPSPLMFGSLPTGVQRNKPWQTLLFHPRPEDSTHPGKGTPAAPALGTSYTTPPDHLIADLFWMPVVEPYAISQPFATSGKINLNYQIAPFTYINRATGIHAVMKSTKCAAFEVADMNSGYMKAMNQYDNGSVTVPTFVPNRRRNIDLRKTLVAFEEKFKGNDLFRSASQICEINLVPPEVTPAAATVAATNTAMAAFWNANQLTGDNLREKPYADLYSRLTTKSNTYTVHVRVQGLKKGPATPAGAAAAALEWREGKDQVVAEYRGSAILERYIDLNDPSLPDFATDTTANIDNYYKMRVISTKRFVP